MDYQGSTMEVTENILGCIGVIAVMGRSKHIGWIQSNRMTGSRQKCVSDRTSFSTIIFPMKFP
jgi:hypothetical protein